MIDEENPLITEALGPYYVYMLIDPRVGEHGEVFYIGKGTGWRFASHLRQDVTEEPDIEEAEAAAEVSRKNARIAEIRRSGREPTVVFARRDLARESDAFAIEATLIDALHRFRGHGLTNAIRGHETDLGLITYDELATQVATPPLVETAHRAILIKLGWWGQNEDSELPRSGYGFKPGMSAEELYDSTRAWWRMRMSKAQQYRYAVAIYQGVTRAVYEIDPSGWRTRGERLGFAGTRLTEGPVFEALFGSVGKRVPAQRPDGRAVFCSGSPIAYWP